MPWQSKAQHNSNDSLNYLRPERDNRKTVICTFYKAGTCTKGWQCSFAHGTNDLKVSDSFPIKTAECIYEFEREGQCWKGDKCTFAHNKEELAFGREQHMDYLARKNSQAPSEASHQDGETVACPDRRCPGYQRENGSHFSGCAYAHPPQRAIYGPGVRSQSEAPGSRRRANERERSDGSNMRSRPERPASPARPIVLSYREQEFLDVPRAEQARPPRRQPLDPSPAEVPTPADFAHDHRLEELMQNTGPEENSSQAMIPVKVAMAKLAAILADRQKLLEDLQAEENEKTTLQQDYAAFQQEHAEEKKRLEEHIDLLEKEKAILTGKLESQSSTLALEELRLELDSHRKIRGQQVTTIAALEGMVAMLQMATAKASDSVNEERQLLEKQNATLRTANEVLLKHNTAEMKSQANLMSHQATLISDLEASKAHLEQQFATFEEQISMLKEQNAKLQTENGKLEEEHADLVSAAEMATPSCKRGHIVVSGQADQKSPELHVSGETPHDASGPDVSGETPHDASGPDVSGETLHDASGPDVSGETLHDASSPDVSGETPHDASSPDVSGETYHDAADKLRWCK